MSTYAQIVDGIVTNIVVADADWISQQPGEWHVYDQSRPAGIGWTWDEYADAFYAPQPFPSWTLDEDYRWQAPVPHPTDGGDYYWDEESGTWLTQ